MLHAAIYIYIYIYLSIPCHVVTTYRHVLTCQPCALYEHLASQFDLVNGTRKLCILDMCLYAKDLDAVLKCIY